MDDHRGAFKPGENGYMKTVPPDLRQARKLTKVEVELILNKYLHLPVGDLLAATQDPMITTIEALVVSILISAIKRGDHDKLNFVLDRLIGKVKDDVKDVVPLSFHEQVVDFISKMDKQLE